MIEQNITKTITPLINTNWDKNNKEILNRLKYILLDSIYFKCLNKISSTYCESLLNGIITSIEYKKYSKNHVLLNYNEPVTKYYFVFKGKLNIYKVNMEKANKNLELVSQEDHNDYNKDEMFQYFYTYIKKYLKSINTENIYISNYKSIYNIKQDEIEKTKNKRAKKFESLFKNIANNNLELDYSINEGKIFGEDFLYNNIPYSNCILECGADCILGELNKEEYDKIYKKFNKIERSFSTVFLVNLKIFYASNNFFSKLQQCLIKRYYSKNEIIFKQGEKFRAFYLIRNGKINLSLKINKTVNCQLEPEIIMGNLIKERFTSNKSYITKGKYSEKVDYNLITLENGEFIGDIEYKEKKDKYLYTAQCTEDCFIFEIDIELFEYFIVNNNNIKDSLKGFYEKIKEKKILLQERIYSIRNNNSAIKKSDYILSKNKFTKNILQGHPLKEEKKNNSLSYKNNNILDENIKVSKKNRTNNDNENFYLSMISPFLKRHSSASKSKKLNTIKFNNDFFIKRNSKKIFSNVNTIYKLKDISNSKSQNTVSKVNISHRLLTEINEAQSTNRSQNKNINLLTEQNNKEKRKINFLLQEKTDSIPSFKDNIKRKKNSLHLFNSKYTTTEKENEKLYDFMDVNLIFSRNDKNKKQNIPIIIKTTKETDIFKQRYNKDKIKKINSYFYKPPKDKNKNKLHLFPLFNY